MKKLLILFLLFAMSPAAKTQVNPPELICIISDTLIWNLPTNTCGSFNSYTIHASTSPDGPFSILATITDPNQTKYYHDIGNNTTWYYYMTTNANCPGEIVISSDTLDSNPPGVSPILYVDVQDGKAVLEWQPSESPEVVGYVIYRVTEIGTVPIDTITTLTYCDVNSTPDTQTENYYVIAIDGCGNTSLINSTHRTVLLNAKSKSCERGADLSWNLYEGWTGIAKQEVWASIDGDVPVLLQTLNSSDTSAFVLTPLDDATYCFFIESYDVDTGLSSSSNEICVNADIVSRVRNLEMKNVSVSNNNEVTITWQWNQDAELSEYTILSSNTNNNLEPVETLPASNSLSLNNFYSDPSATPNLGSVYYQIETRDDCDSLALSNIGRTIYLTGAADETVLENQINWTPFTLNNATVFQYEIFRIGTNGFSSVGIVDGNTTSFSDTVNPREESDAQVCYLIEASSNISLASGAEEVISSRSNTICLEQPTGIIAPNAFAPAGVNYEFRPLLRFGETADYNMTIWDRYGQKIFETDDVNTGWTGRKGFHEYPTGVYTYRIQVVQMSGRRVEETGSVTLVR